VQLHRDREKFAASGARLVVIGQGEPEDARAFMKTLDVDLPIYVDRSRAAYKAAGAKVGTLSELIGPKSLLRGMKRTASERVHQGRIVGHAAQLGGVFVIKPDGSIPYAHLAQDASDNPPNEEVLAAVRDAMA
jgi:prostamide/prostaglandin F2alpha synthase